MKRSGLVLVRAGRTELAGGDLTYGVGKVTLVTCGRPVHLRELGGLVRQTLNVSGTGKDKIKCNEWRNQAVEQHHPE